MKIYPHAELVRLAREAYARQAKARPSPKIKNLPAVIRHLQPRVFRFVEGGIGFRAPPLTWRQALQATVIREALREAMQDEMITAPVVAQAFRLLRAILQPQSRWRRWTGWSIPPLSDTQVANILDWLLDVPIEDIVSEPSDEPAKFDWIDELYGFALAYPSLVDARGEPRYWAHYIYGLHHLARRNARDAVRSSMAARMAQADAEDWKSYDRGMRLVAGWS